MRPIKHALLTIAVGSFSVAAHASIDPPQSTDFGFAPPAGTSALIDFEGPLPTGFTRVGGLVRNVDDSLGAEPAIATNVKETSYYLSANNGDSATITSSLGYRDVSLYWGSIDKYNTLSLLDKLGGTIASYSGNDIWLPANGNQFDGSTNRRVSFHSTDAATAIYGLKFESSSPAFEVDNIAFSSAVPEPAAWGMMILGLGVVGFALRRSSALTRGTKAFA